MTCILDLSLSADSEWQPEECSNNHCLSQASQLGFGLSLASVSLVLGGCPGCQKCWWLFSVSSLQCQKLNERSGGWSSFLASPALPLLLATGHALDYTCSPWSLLTRCVPMQAVSTCCLLQVRWDRRKQLESGKALCKINWVQKTPKRMKLFAGHDENFNICIITLTCVNWIHFFSHSERSWF